MSTATAESQTIQTLQAMDDDFVRNANAGDVETLVSAFYAEDAEILPPGAPSLRGHADILRCWQGMVSAGLNFTVLKALRIEESGDLAYASGVYELTLSPPGRDTVADSGKYVVVYRRQADGSWKAIADIFNSSRPAA